MEMEKVLQMLEELWKTKKHHEELKKATDEASKVLTSKKIEMRKILTEMGITKQQVPGYGTVSVTSKVSYKTPKVPDDKKQLFKYIEENHGKDTLDNLISINSATLNSFAKTEVERMIEDGNDDFLIPGLEAPTLSEDIRFTKERAK